MPNPEYRVRIVRRWVDTFRNSPREGRGRQPTSDEIWAYIKKMWPNLPEADQEWIFQRI